MPTWPKDTTAAKNAFYGDFHGKNWGSENLVRVIPPFKMYYEKNLMKSGILVHKKIKPALEAVFAEVWEKCGKDQAKTDKTGITDFGGCFNIRQIAGSNSYSNHSWACAIDLSPGMNGFNMKSTLSSSVVNAFKRQGALWGGDYKGRKDPMHFEFVSAT